MQYKKLIIQIAASIQKILTLREEKSNFPNNYFKNTSLQQEQKNSVYNIKNKKVR